MKRLFITSFIALSSFLTGCIKEDYTECPPTINAEINNQDEDKSINTK